MPRKSKTHTVEITALTITEQPRSSAGRKCAVCSHPSVTKINAMIRKPESFRRISSHFGMSDRSVSRHAEKCLNIEIQALIKEKKIIQAFDHYEEINKQLIFAHELQAAAKELLMCEETDRISFMPRANDIDIVYEDLTELDWITGFPKRKTMDLQTIINKLKGFPEVRNLRAVVKFQDMKDYALRTIDAYDKLLDKVAKVEGLYKKDQANDETPKPTADAIISEARAMAEKHETTLEAVINHGIENEYIPREFHQEIRLKLAAEAGK